MDHQFNRNLLLKKVYLATNANPRAYVNSFELTTDMGIDRETLSNYIHTLEDLGYLKHLAKGEQFFEVCITTSGIIYVETSGMLSSDDLQ